MSCPEIEIYVAGLGAALHGPADVRGRLLAEARGGLYDACDAYRDAGQPEPDAVALALRDFGSVAAVRRAYQGELFEVQARRTATVLAIKIPVAAVLWTAAWAANPYQHWDLPGAVKAVSAGLGLVALGLAVVGYLAGVRAPDRRFGPALLVPASVASTAALVTAVLLHAVPSYGAMAWPPMTLVVAVTALLTASIIASARRCRLVALA